MCAFFAATWINAFHSLIQRLRTNTSSCRDAKRSELRFLRMSQPSMVRRFVSLNGYFGSGGSITRKAKPVTSSRPVRYAISFRWRIFHVTGPDCKVQCERTLLIVNRDLVHFRVVQAIGKGVFQLLQCHCVLTSAAVQSAQ